MKLTLIDLMTVYVFLGSPMAAGMAAIKAGAGWLTLAFIALGFAAGVGNAYLVRTVIYWLATIECKLVARDFQSKWWIHWCLNFSFPLGVLVILVTSFACLFGVSLGTDFLVRRTF